MKRIKVIIIINNIIIKSFLLFNYAILNSPDLYNCTTFAGFVEIKNLKIGL